MNNKNYKPGFEKESFQVPDGYFEQLSQQIDRKIAEKSTPKVRSINQPLWSVISVAATLLVALGIWWLTPASTGSNSSTSLATSEIIDSGELDDLFLQQEEAILALVEEQPLLHNEDLSYEEISEYLLQEDVSESDIYNYLESY